MTVSVIHVPYELTQHRAFGMLRELFPIWELLLRFVFPGWQNAEGMAPSGLDGLVESYSTMDLAWMVWGFFNPEGLCGGRS